MKIEIASDEVVYRGKVIDVHRVGVKTDDGKVVQREKVVMVEAVVILPLLADGRLVAIRNERFIPGEELLEFPAGKIDGDESPEAAAHRELEEETGYSAGCLVKLGGFYSAPGISTEYLHAFLATELTAGPQRLEGYERIQVYPIEPQRLASMIASGEMHDSKSLSTYLLWQLRGSM